MWCVCGMCGRDVLYICIRACMCMCGIHVPMCVFIHVCAHLPTHISHMHTHTPQTCIHTCMFAHIHMHTNKHYTHTGIHIHTTHTYNTHIYIYHIHMHISYPTSPTPHIKHIHEHIYTLMCIHTKHAYTHSITLAINT